MILKFCKSLNFFVLSDGKKEIAINEEDLLQKTNNDIRIKHCIEYCKKNYDIKVEIKDK